MTSSATKREELRKENIPDMIINPSNGKRYLKGRFLGKVHKCVMKFIVHCREFTSFKFLYISDVFYNQNRTTKSDLSDTKRLLSKLDKFRHECKWLNLKGPVFVLYFVLFCNKFDIFSEVFVVLLQVFIICFMSMLAQCRGNKNSGI